MADSFYHHLIEVGQQGHVCTPVPISDNCNQSEEDLVPVTISKYWLDLNSIREEKQYNPLYQTLIDKLKVKYSCWKKSRGDGNCYYRSVMSSFMIKLCAPTTNVNHLENFINNLCGLSNNCYNTQRNTPDYFYKMICQVYNAKGSFEDRIGWFKNIHQYLQDPNFDKELINLGRMFAYYYFLKNKDDERIAPYLLDGDFEKILTRIEIYGEEAEGFDLLLLPLGLGIVVTKVNIFDTLIVNYYPDEEGNSNKLRINILCKSRGHYDCLYSKYDLKLDRYNLEQKAFCFKENL